MRPDVLAQVPAPLPPPPDPVEMGARITAIILLVLVHFILVWDVYAGMRWGGRASVSYILHGWVEAYPIILFGKDYWGGLVDWVKQVLLAQRMIADPDLLLLHCTDSPAEAVEIVVRSQDALSRMREEYDELDAESARIAHALVEARCKPGDRVAVQVEKCWQALALYLATLARTSGRGRALARARA